MTSLRYLPATALALTFFISNAPAPANAADAFYTRLLERGVRDLELGQTENATARLRTACFGLLEEPSLLTECLMQLGRAQARVGKSDDLSTTAERLAELEDRFGSYAAFGGDLKTEFESELRNTLPQALLSRMPVFSHLAQSPFEEATEAEPLSPRQQRKALEKRLAEEPTDSEAQLALARLQYARGKLKPAGALLDQLLANQPDNPEAICLRAQIAVGTRECAPALAGLDACTGLTSSNQNAAFVLECLASSGRTGDAVALLQSLPAERAQSGPVADVVKRIIDSAPAELAGAVPGEALVVSTESTPDLDQQAQADTQETTEPAAPAEPSRPPVQSDEELERRLEEVRRQVSGSRYREELEAALANASRLADDYPASARAQDLAVETAYLGAEWQAVLDYFERGDGASGRRPVIVFYAAVAHYELGNRARAAEILQGALAGLPRSSFVDEYLDKILIPDSP